MEYIKSQVRRTELQYLRRGDVIRHLDILYVYDRIPSGSSNIYVRTLDKSKHFKIRVRTLQDVFDVVGFCEDIFNERIPNDTNELVEGDLFVIDHNTKGSFIYRFERLTRGEQTIIATNPMNNKEVRISRGFICTKIDNLPY